jgi:hypothetical protein
MSHSLIDANRSVKPTNGTFCGRSSRSESSEFRRSTDKIFSDDENETKKIPVEETTRKLRQLVELTK